MPITPTLLERGFCTAVNHLLSADANARAELARQAGKVVRFNLDLFALNLQIASDGLTEAAADAETNVTIHIRAADLPLIAQQRERVFAYVNIDGDADLANTVSQLFNNLRWDIEHDLSQWVGALAAQQLVSGAGAAISTLHATRQKLSENVAEYLLEEQPLLVRPQAVRDLGADINALRHDVERLGKRIERLIAQINHAT